MGRILGELRAIKLWLGGAVTFGVGLGFIGLMSPIPGQAEEGSPTPSLDTKLNDALGAKALAGATVGLKVVKARDGSVVFDHGGDTLLNPASNLKILTAAVALDSLGGAYTFPTQVFSDATPDSSGVLSGNLYIKGHGDPELVFEEVFKLARDLHALGIRKVEGDLIGDDSYFDEAGYIPGWEPGGDDLSRAYYAPIGALSFNFNTVAVLMTPGDEKGQPAKVTLETPTSFVTIDNQVTTASKSRGLSVLRRSGGGPGEFNASGSISESAGPLRFYRAIGAPTEFALTLFKEQLAAVGIEIKGDRRRGVVPQGAVLLHQTYSASLDVLLKYMNKISSNFIAEHVLKGIGAEEYGAPGTTDKGLQAVNAWLKGRGIWREGMSIYNASGLSQGTKVPPSLLTDILREMLKDPRHSPEFVSSLPIAGVDGTLRSRMRNGPATGLVRAKTGSIDGVYAMSGYIFRESGDHLIFSLVANDITGYRSATRGAMEDIILTLAEAN